MWCKSVSESLGTGKKSMRKAVLCQCKIKPCSVSKDPLQLFKERIYILKSGEEIVQTFSGLFF